MRPYHVQRVKKGHRGCEAASGDNTCNPVLSSTEGASAAQGRRGGRRCGGPSRHGAAAREQRAATGLSHARQKMQRCVSNEARRTGVSIAHPATPVQLKPRRGEPWNRVLSEGAINVPVEVEKEAGTPPTKEAPGNAQAFYGDDDDERAAVGCVLGGALAGRGGRR